MRGGGSSLCVILERSEESRLRKRHAEKTTFDGTKLPMVEKASQNHHLLYDNPNRCQTKMPELNMTSQVS